MTHHGTAFRKLTDDQELLSQLIQDYTNADITDAEKGMLKYVEKLTVTPAKMAAEDLDNLRSCGFNDRDIFDINQVVAYFNYVNRIADGLGVELER